MDEWVRDRGVAGGWVAETADLVVGLAALIDEWAHGAVVTTLQGRVLHANPVAQVELRRHAVVVMRGRWLRGVTPECEEALRRALSQVDKGKRSLLSFPQADGGQASLAVVPLGGGPGRQPDCAGVVLARTAVCEAFMLCFFARSHGLTRTEELVLGLLARGCTAPEVAGQLGIAVSTVRSHVRNLCVKTRASGVRDLVKRVAVLPPVAAALLPGSMP